MIFFEIVQRAGHRTGRQHHLQAGKRCEKHAGGHIGQPLFAEKGGHPLHLGGNGGVFCGEVGVVAAGVHRHQGQSLLCKIDLQTADGGRC